MWRLGMRPGTKIPFWTPGYKHRPEVEPPGMLRIVAGLSVFSIVGTLVHAVALTMTSTSSPQNSGSEAMYIALLHFVLPFVVVYTFSTNNPASRFVIAIHVAILYAATLGGKGYFGAGNIDPVARITVSTIALILICTWLFLSPRMRLYYALISDRPLPADLAARAEELAGHNWMTPNTRAVIDWIADKLELLVMIGLIVAAIYAYISTG